MDPCHHGVIRTIRLSSGDRNKIRASEVAASTPVSLDLAFSVTGSG